MYKLGSELNQLDNESALHGQEKQTWKKACTLKMQKKNKKESAAYSDTWNTKGSLTKFIILLIINKFYIS